MFFEKLFRFRSLPAYYVKKINLITNEIHKEEEEGASVIEISSLGWMEVYWERRSEAWGVRGQGMEGERWPGHSAEQHADAGELCNLGDGQHIVPITTPLESPCVCGSEY